MFPRSRVTRTTCSRHDALNLTDCSGRMARGSKSSDSKTGSNANPAGAVVSRLVLSSRHASLACFAGGGSLRALWPYVAQKLPSLAGRAEYRLAFHQIQITPPPVRPVPENLVQQVEES